MRMIGILIILMVSVFSLTYCSTLPSGQDSKRGTVIEVKHNEKKIILYERSYALLIGISKYEYSDWYELPSIPGEMEKLKFALEKKGFIVWKLLNSTSAKLKNKIEDFISEKGLKENNRLLIYFSGHGYTRNNGKKGYVVPSDTPHPKKNLNEFVKKAIEMAQIMAWARTIESKHALLIFDSCFSGTIFLSKSASQTPAYIAEFTGKPVRQFITAGSAYERVPARSNLVPYFIRGIAGEADYTKDGYITASELSLYVHGQITALNIRQTPQYGKIRDPDLDQGDFVFILGKTGAGDNNIIENPIIQGSGFQSLRDELTVSRGSFIKISENFEYSNDKKYWLCFLDGERIWPMVEITDTRIEKNISIPTTGFYGGKLALAVVQDEKNDQFKSWLGSGSHQPLLKPKNLKIILETIIILK
jgi:hypothetical protein